MRACLKAGPGSARPARLTPLFQRGELLFSTAPGERGPCGQCLHDPNWLLLLLSLGGKRTGGEVMRFLLPRAREPLSPLLQSWAESLSREQPRRGPHPLLGGPAQPPGPVPGPVAAAEGEECASSLPEGEGASSLAAAPPQEWGHKAGI